MRRLAASRDPQPVSQCADGKEGDTVRAAGATRHLAAGEWDVRGDAPATRAFTGGLRLSPHHPRESAVSLTNDVRCGYAEGSLSGRGCEGCDLGAAGGGGERGRDRPADRDAEADGE